MHHRTIHDATSFKAVAHAQPLAAKEQQDGVLLQVPLFREHVQNLRQCSNSEAHVDIKPFTLGQ